MSNRQIEKTEPRQITQEEAWQISCHEAGHAVVGVRHQIPFLHVERDDGEYGEVPVGAGPVANPTEECTADEMAKWQLFYAGGAAAEQLLFGQYREYGSRRDQSLHAVLEKRRHPLRNDGWACDIQSAMCILDGESVEKVAKELDRHKKLSAEEVYDLLNCVPPWY